MDTSFASWGEQPSACPTCGHTGLSREWGQCLRCGQLERHWICDRDFRHGFPYAGHECGEPLDRRPSWETD